MSQAQAPPPAAEQTVLTHADGEILVVTLNRPERFNALTAPMLHTLTETWSVAADPAVRAVVVTGAGRGFCAGADLTASRSADNPATSGLRHTYNPHITALVGLDKPVIAALNGPVAGAGLAIALAADIRIAVESAKLVPAFSAIGLVPDSGVTYLAPRLLGPARSFEWLASGRAIHMPEALELGLVAEVVSEGTLLERALERAHALADQPGLGVALTKRALNTASRRLLLEQLELETQLQEQAVRAPGRAEARARVADRLGHAPRTPSGTGENA